MDIDCSKLNSDADSYILKLYNVAVMYYKYFSTYHNFFRKMRKQSNYLIFEDVISDSIGRGRLHYG